jgi:hypothetical protein
MKMGGGGESKFYYLLDKTNGHHFPVQSPWNLSLRTSRITLLQWGGVTCWLSKLSSGSGKVKEVLQHGMISKRCFRTTELFDITRSDTSRLPAGPFRRWKKTHLKISIKTGHYFITSTLMQTGPRIGDTPVLWKKFLLNSKRLYLLSMIYFQDMYLLSMIYFQDINVLYKYMCIYTYWFTSVLMGRANSVCVCVCGRQRFPSKRVSPADIFMEVARTVVSSWAFAVWSSFS